MVAMVASCVWIEIMMDKSYIKSLKKPIFIEDYIVDLKSPDDLKISGYKGTNPEYHYNYELKEYEKNKEQLVKALQKCDFIFKHYRKGCSCNQGYGIILFNLTNLPKYNRRKKQRRLKSSKYELIPSRRLKDRRIYDLGFCGYEILCQGCKSQHILELPLDDRNLYAIYAFVKNNLCVDNGLRFTSNGSGGIFFISEYRKEIKRKMILKGHVKWDDKYYKKYGSGHRYFKNNYKVD